MNHRTSSQLDTLLSLASRPARLASTGISAGALRRPEWRHPLHGIVRPAGVGLDETEERISTAIGALTDGCVLGGWAAGFAQGVERWDGFDRWGRARDVLIHCAPGSQLRRRSGIRPSQGRLLANEVRELGGIAVTTLARATFDELCMATNLDEAVVALDAAVGLLLQPHTTVDAVRRVVSGHPKRRGIVQARASLELASVRALSPWETRLRLRALEELPIETTLLVNTPVFTSGGTLLGVPDLLEPGSGLELESDGAQHREEEAHAEDNAREEKFEDCGLTVIRFGAGDHRDATQMARRIRGGHRRALSRNRVSGGWTLDIPAWWHGSNLASIWHYP